MEDKVIIKKENNTIDFISEYETKLQEFKDITHMLWLIYEDYYTMQKNNLYEKADKYDRLGIFLLNIHSLLFKTITEMEKFIKSEV